MSRPGSTLIQPEPEQLYVPLGPPVIILIIVFVIVIVFVINIIAVITVFVIIISCYHQQYSPTFIRNYPHLFYDF